MHTKTLRVRILAVHFFMRLSGMTREKTSIVFYKITSSRTISVIIEKLARKEYGPDNMPFITAYFLTGLDALSCS
jgi:hypothetical protein